MLVTDNAIVSQHMGYHLSKNLSISESIFRHGSEAWANLICEARQLYMDGFVLEIDENEYFMITGDTGKQAIFENQNVYLDTPEILWDKPGYYEAFILDNDVIKRIEFTKE